MKTLLLALAAAATFAAPAVAWACSCSPPLPVVFSGSGQVPTNLGGVAVSFGPDWVEEGGLTIERWVDDAWIAEEAAVESVEDPGGFASSETLTFVRPSPFEPGDRFRISAETEYYVDPVVAEIEVESELPAIGADPVLTVGEQETVSLSVTAGSSCDQPALLATRPVSVALPAELEPYRDLLLYETTVDDAPWRTSTSLCSAPSVGRSWQGAGVDLLAAVCASQHGDLELLGEAPFEVRVHAYFPGTALPVWSTAAVKTQLTCPAECMEYSYVEEDFVPCAEDDEDVDDDDGNEPGLTPDDSDAGCSSVRSAPGSALLLLLLGALLRRRRVS